MKSLSKFIPPGLSWTKGLLMMISHRRPALEPLDSSSSLMTSKGGTLDATSASVECEQSLPVCIPSEVTWKVSVKGPGPSGGTKYGKLGRPPIALPANMTSVWTLCKNNSNSAARKGENHEQKLGKGLFFFFFLAKETFPWWEKKKSESWGLALLAAREAAKTWPARSEKSRAAKLSSLHWSHVS